MKFEKLETKKMNTNVETALEKFENDEVLEVLKKYENREWIKVELKGSE